MKRLFIIWGSLILLGHPICLARIIIQERDTITYVRCESDSNITDYTEEERNDFNKKYTNTRLSSPFDSLVFIQPVKQRPWLAAAETVGFHFGLLAFDRFVLDGAYAHVTMKTIRRNLKMNQWYWDSDLMRTNLFNHPYHGMLYYNAARSNGMNFWQSSLYATAGSLLWELIGEMELPSVNDFLSTTFGGIAIGEVSQRLSDLMIDDTQTGGNRIVSELAGAAINPMRGLTRLLTGEAWRRNTRRTTFVPTKFEMAVNTGFRHLSVSGKEQGNLNTAYLDIDINYGDAVVEERRNKPFEHFVLSLGFAPGRHQQLLNHLKLRGRLFALPLLTDSWKAECGFYQHFTYLYSDGVNGGEVPYKLSEAGCLGPGIVCEREHDENGYFRQELYVNGIILGGVMSDYSGNLIDRNYNIGSGFSLKSYTNFGIYDWLRAGVELSYFRLFTWLDFRDINTNKEPVDWSTQGDASVAGLWLFSPHIEIRIHKNLGIRMSGNYYNRHTRYRYQQNCHSHTWEWRLGVNYTIK